MYICRFSEAFRSFIITVIIARTSLKRSLCIEKILYLAAFVFFLKTKARCLTLSVLLMLVTKQLDQRGLILNKDDLVLLYGGC